MHFHGDNGVQQWIVFGGLLRTEAPVANEG